MKFLSLCLFALLAIPARANYTLAISTAGPASASVIVSTPAGINCGSTNTTCSASFAAGSTVTLAEDCVVPAVWSRTGKARSDRPGSQETCADRKPT